MVHHLDEIKKRKLKTILIVIELWRKSESCKDVNEKLKHKPLIQSRELETCTEKQQY